MDKKLIVLNGPPSCGKDTLAYYLTIKTGMVHVKFAAELKFITHRLYGIPNPEDIYQFEDCKDVPNSAFYGLTPRQAYIEVSERYIKPVHGMGFFGDRLLETIEELPNKVFVASDGGLIEELIPVVEGLGSRNVLVLQMHRSGCDFESKGDSRSFYPISQLDELRVVSRQIQNDTTLDILFVKGERVISNWLRWA